MRWYQATKLALVGLVLVLGLGVPLAKADTVSLRASPVVVEDEVAPGETIQRQITLENLTDVPLPLRATIVAVAPKGEDGEVGVVESSGGLDKWVSTNNEIILDPGIRSISVQVAVPADAKPGTQLAGLLLRPLNSATNTTSEVQVRLEVLILLSITVKGNTVLQAEIDSFTAPAVAVGSQLPMQVRLRNQGSVVVNPVTTIIIRSLFGNQIDQVSGDAQGMLTAYPGSVRAQTYQWQINALPGIYRADVVARDGLLRVEAKRWFILFPLSLAIPLLVLLAGVFGWYGQRRGWWATLLRRFLRSRVVRMVMRI